MAVRGKFWFKRVLTQCIVGLGLAPTVPDNAYSERQEQAPALQIAIPIYAYKPKFIHGYPTCGMTDIIIPTIIIPAQRSLYKVCSSSNTSFPPIIVNRTLHCFISVIVITELFSYLHASNSALSPNTNSILIIMSQ